MINRTGRIYRALGHSQCLTVRRVDEILVYCPTLVSRDFESKVVVVPGGTFKPTLDWFLEECEKAHRDKLGECALV